MNVLRRICACSAFLAVASSGALTHASFHFWQIKEIYSNADGSVQFIEFFTTFSGQQSLGLHNIVATSTVGGTPTVREFNFVTPLSLAPPNPSSTANRHMLIATAGFGALAGGVTPDYTLPAGGPFFNPNADSITIDFAHTFDVLTIAGSALPNNGVSSLNDSDTTPGGPDVLSVATNSPTNFAGAAGAVNLGGATPIPGDFNGDNLVNGVDLTIWRNNFGATGAPTVSQGNADADSDVDGRDFLIWQRGGSPTVQAIPEPAATILIAFAALAAAARARSASKGVKTATP